MIIIVEGNSTKSLPKDPVVFLRFVERYVVTFHRLNNELISKYIFFVTIKASLG